MGQGNQGGKPRGKTKGENQGPDQGASQSMQSWSTSGPSRVRPHGRSVRTFLQKKQVRTPPSGTARATRGAADADRQQRPNEAPVKKGRAAVQPAGEGGRCGARQGARMRQQAAAALGGGCRGEATAPSRPLQIA